MRFRRPSKRAVILGLLAVVVLLGVLALPFLKAPGSAEAAKSDLMAAKDALSEGDTDTAIAKVESARKNTDEVQGAVQGIGGDVWSWVPLAGGPVRDVRRLGNALDELVSVAETGAELLPEMTGEDATLYDEGNIHLPTLARVTEQAEGASVRLDNARAELEEIADRRLIAGTMMADPRDEALDQVIPLADGAEALEPVLDTLPEVLGEGSKRRYILALLNPAEMLYSGGTPQSFSMIDFDNGKLTMSETMDISTNPEFGKQRKWKKVRGNPFHTGKIRLATATMPPNWPVAGHELTNAWRAARGEQMDGVIAIDVVALSNLVALTGPLKVPGIDEPLTADTMVKQLIGSYDAYPDMNERKEINRALGDSFADRLFAGDPVDTIRVLAESARQRRFAVYLHDSHEQESFDALGLSGDLGSADGDYLGVFTQNRVASKSDFWQRRAVTSEVTLAEDGSATVDLEIEVHNDSPPYLQYYPDPGSGYFTRHNSLSIAAFLPPDITLTSAKLDNKVLKGKVRSRYFDRTFVRVIADFQPKQKRTFSLSYEVPKAAEVTDDGLLYRLALDPQGMVNLQAMSVKVNFPEGYDIGRLPDLWTASGDNSVSFTTEGMGVRQSVEIPASN